MEKNRRSKLALMLTTLVLLLVLVVGSVAPGVAARVVGPQVAAAGLSEQASLIWISPCPFDHGGSGG